MSSHPDADAFIQAVLRDPTDTTTRLVFADWLEETGTLPNRAWAYYLRLQANAQHLPEGSREHHLLEVEAATHAPYITARPTVPAEVSIKHHRSLIHLLPTASITVTLTEHEIPLAVVELMPESVARENLVLPLDLQGRVLLVVSHDPTDPDTIQRLEFILNKDIVAFRGEAEDILAAINRHYGQTETESVDSVQYILPIEFDLRPGAPAGYGDEPDAIVQLVNTILRDGRARGSDRVLISPVGGVGVKFREGGTWSPPEPLPDQLLGAVAGRVVRMVDDRYGFEHSGRASGRFHCRLGRDRFLVQATIETLDEGPAIQLDLDVDDPIEFH